MSTAPIGGSGGGGDDPTAAAAQEAAQALEAYFVRQMLSQLKMPGAGAESGFAAETFGDMLRDALSESMASSDQLGLQKTLRPALVPDEGANASTEDAALPEPAATDAEGAVASAIESPFFLDPPLKPGPVRSSRPLEE